MNKLRIFVILISILVSPINILNTLSQQKIKFVTVETRDFPAGYKESEMFSALYVAQDGMVYIGLCTNGGSSHFYQYSPAADKIRHIAYISEFLGESGKGIRTSGKIHTRPVEDKEGNIYFGTMCEDAGPRDIDPDSWRGAHWLRYSPERDKLEGLGLIGKWGIYGLAIDVKRNRLFATAWDGRLYRHDIDTGKTHNLGRVDNWDDLRHIVADDEGNVYGCYPKGYMWKYDAEKERIVDLNVRIPYDPAVFPRRLSNPMLDRKAIWRVVIWDSVDKAVYGVDGGSSFLFKYEPYVESEGRITKLEKLCSDEYYYSDRKDIPYSTLALTLGNDRKIYYAPVAMAFDFTKKLEAAKLAMKQRGIIKNIGISIITYDLKNGKRENLGMMRTSEGNIVLGCGAAATGKDGTIYFCGAVEENDPNKVAGKAGGLVPFSMKLIIYRHD